MAWQHPEHIGLAQPALTPLRLHHRPPVTPCDRGPVRPRIVSDSQYEREGSAIHCYPLVLNIRQAVTIPPDGGHAGNRTRLIKLLAEETGGATGFVVSTMAPGLLVPPHHHDREHEIAYTLSGELTWLLDGEESQAPAGTTVWRPIGSSHAVWASSAEPARLIEVMIPGGWETVLLEADAQFAAGTLSLDEFVARASDRGVHFDIASGRKIARERALRMIGDPAPL